MSAATSTGWYQLGPALTRTKRVRPYQLRPDDPLERHVMIFTRDPETYREGGIEHLAIPYEPLQPGPAGSLLKVVDDDGHQKNLPVNLDDPKLLISHGLEPSPVNPQFHQQMAYAVCSWVYDRFRHALGRVIEWGFDGRAEEDCVRLRIQPHYEAAKENAWYDSDNGTLSFGYFTPAGEVFGRNIPKRTVFTCLSHDIVVHEFTHALLDGLRTKFMLPTGPDVLAFHEGFADLVAIFTHFSHPGVVRAAIRERGPKALDAGLLTEIAKQFFNTTGLNPSLRAPVEADPRNPRPYDPNCDCHELGTVLVSAVFQAFSTVWKRKTEPLFRLLGKTSQSAGDFLPYELEEMLADSASLLAEQFLSICIRALDYCPVVDIEFGEYLRALITADRALVRDDTYGYRDALIQAFSQRRIYPPNVGCFSEDALLWAPPEAPIPVIRELTFAELRFDGDPGNPVAAEDLARQARGLGNVVTSAQFIKEFGLVLGGNPALEGDTVDPPTIESIRSCRRIGPDGQIQFDTVAEITQRRHLSKSGLDVYGGCTVVVSPRGNVRYVIGKSVLNKERIAFQEKWIKERAGTVFWRDGAPLPHPLRMIHEQRRKAAGAAITAS